MPDQHTITMTDRARKTFSGVIVGTAERLHKMGIHPDAITIFGFVLVVISAVIIATGRFQLAFVVLLLSSPSDFMDGAVARVMGRKSQFGALLDSTIDRYADGVIYIGFAYYFATQSDFVFMVLALIAMIGSFLVSYVRSRAETLGVAIKFGLFTRMERFLTFLLILIVPALIPIGIVVLAVGTNFTAMRRLYYASRELERIAASQQQQVVS